MQQNSTRQDWQTRVDAVLKGKTFVGDAALQGRIDGPRAFRAQHAPWKVFARIDQTDVAKAKAQALDDLGHGVDGLILTSIECASVLDELPLHKANLRNEAGDLGAEALRVAIARQPVDPARLEVDFGIDDVQLVHSVQQSGFDGPFVRADGRSFHAQGLSDAEELGSTLATALSKLRKLDWLDDTSLAAAVSLTLTANQNMFTTMAKFRAARILWAEILKISGLPEAPLALHAETSRVMFADVDAHTNILRSVTATFGAGLGGADSICVLPFSFNQGVPNSFARRVARNLQTLLLHESELWRVSDSAAGAGVIEKQTNEICDQAWSFMQSCERGRWPVSDASQSKARPIIGVSKYANLKVDAPEVEATL